MAVHAALDPLNRRSTAAGIKDSDPEIHLISGGGTRLDKFLLIAETVHSWVDYIHLREKACTANELYQAVKEMTRRGVPLAKIVVNDRLDVALAAGAGGVQLAGHSLPPAAARPHAPGLRIGRSVHSPAEAAASAGEGADYCLYGHVYASASKPGLPGRGLDRLAETVRACPVPVIAIGGIEPGNAGQVLSTGAAGIAVLSGICGAADPAAAAMAYRAAVQAARLERR
ncbi:thiazole tautomerase TenI [Paenibacillus sp. 7124]|uniref:Thiazole tautomerase TenI n=1 Tax=Paenibacillus apii TaxID=1850370 RepID=A0A6M1PKH2_9BACL|nr:thiamine phosphate synthase [Paenibacillus apii]NGM83084.1 thiazole tautomerase TenI [Paenibacillus apii]NJJ40225.1 thiazole tautomerase TenI [Paenibacillus apii]